MRSVRLDAASRSVLLDGASRNVLFDGASRNVLFVVLDVLADVMGVVEREFVLAGVGGDCVEVGRAARRRGLFVGVDIFALFAATVVVVGVAGDCRALAVVVAMRGLRGGAVEAGEAGESWERTVKRGGGVDFGFDILAASRGFRGAVRRPLGRSLIVDIMVVVVGDALHCEGRRMVGRPQDVIATVLDGRFVCCVSGCFKSPVSGDSLLQIVDGRLRHKCSYCISTGSR